MTLSLSIVCGGFSSRIDRKNKIYSDMSSAWLYISVFSFQRRVKVCAGDCSLWEALLSRIPPFLKSGERGPPPSLPRSLELSSLFALFCFGSSSLHPTAPPPPAVPKETDKGLESLADTISQLFPSPPPRSNLGKACTHQCQKKVNGYRINHSKPLTGHKLPSAHITIRPNHLLCCVFRRGCPTCYFGGHCVVPTTSAVSNVTAEGTSQFGMPLWRRHSNIYQRPQR